MRGLLCLLLLGLWTNDVEARTLVKRSLPRAPEWTKNTPPPEAEVLWFVGFTSGAVALEDAREVAFKKALSEIVGYVGQRGRVVFSSDEVETKTGSSYRVSMSIHLEGQEITLRGMQLADVYYEEYLEGTKRSFDCYALVRYPRIEYTAVMAELKKERELVERGEEERAMLAHARYQSGRAADPAQAVALYEEALQILRALKKPVSLRAGASFESSAVLAEHVVRELAKAKVLRDTKYRTVAVRAKCTHEGVEVSCGSEMESQLIDVALNLGFRAVTSTAATLRVEVDVAAADSGEGSGMCFARARGAWRIYEGEKIVASGELAEQKGAQLTKERAASAAIVRARGQAGLELRKALKKLW